MLEQALWVEKWRPRTINDTVLPSELKSVFQKFVVDKFVPNLLLSGRAGIGKTTVARALLEELACDYIVINGSLNGNIDTLRNEIRTFASSVSLSGGRKYVILDEADYLNPNSTQPALRNFMEEYSKNCGFILTCNFKNRIIEPLHSRCSVVDFKLPKEEKPKIAASFYRRVVEILTHEHVTFDSKAVAGVVEKHFPDFRRTLNELQRYAATGAIDAGILANKKDETFKELFEYIKTKNFTSVRKWVGENSDIDSTMFFRTLYDVLSEQLKPSSVAQLVLTLADYQYKAAFVSDPEINLTACLAEIMVQVEFK
jgi:DNA polymerase III delta prime subunit